MKGKVHTCTLCVCVSSVPSAKRILGTVLLPHIVRRRVADDGRRGWMTDCVHPFDGRHRAHRGSTLAFNHNDGRTRHTTRVRCGRARCSAAHDDDAAASRQNTRRRNTVADAVERRVA